MARPRTPVLFVAAWMTVATLAAPLGPAGAQSATDTTPSSVPQVLRDGPGDLDPGPPPGQNAPLAAPGASPKAGVGQYGPPDWLPLRNPALVGCVMTNCGPPPYHGTWAIDLLDPANQPGDPIFAAGAGQARIIQTGTTCTGTNPPGNIVEVDHGGGLVTWYAHLNSFSISDGQWVDQNTQVGTMGSTGITDPCPANHLHYEERLNGTRVDPGSLKACHGSTLVSYPEILGFSNWDQVPEFVHSVHSDGTACAGGGGSLPPPADFDGDGDTNPSIYRPNSGQWFLQGANPNLVTWGASTDIPVPGDYNDDNSADVAVYRPSTGQWFIRNGNPGVVVWGVSGDIPVPADYNGGATDIAVYRPSTGQWFIRGGTTVTWGGANDVPVPADYDGDGDADIAVYRPSTGQWFILNGAIVVWGAANDIPVPGDYNGDNVDDIAVYRPSTGQWFIRNVSPGVVVWGAANDVPVPGDYNADGTTDIAVYRPSTGQWFIRNVSPGLVFWGATGDLPLVLPWAIYDRYF